MMRLEAGDNKQRYDTRTGIVSLIYGTIAENLRKYCQWRDRRLSTHADLTSTRRAPIRPILGIWGAKFPQNGRFPAQDAPEPPCKIWHR